MTVTLAISILAFGLLTWQVLEVEEKPWNRPISIAGALLDQVDGNQHRPWRSVERESEYLRRAAGHLHEAVAFLEGGGGDPRTRRLLYRQLALIYTQLKEPWNAAACRWLSGFQGVLNTDEEGR